MNNVELRKHFIESLYHTLEDVVSPTPYLEITEGEKINVAFLDGKGKLPAEKSIEINGLDIDIASLFFDEFSLLREGVTGVGKTYTTDALFRTIFGQDGQTTVRLGGGLLGASALELFTITKLENGVPRTYVDHEKCQKYGAIFLDEINRGDTQEVFQVVDGEIHVNGETGYLRIPISNTGRYKKLKIIAAMNPADAQHSSALELDLAGENRFLKFTFPNGVEEAGSSQLESKAYYDLYKIFWDSFRQKTGLKGEWKELYPLVTDQESVKNELNNDAREFIDLAIGYVSKDPMALMKRNEELLKSVGYTMLCKVNESNDLQRIRDIQKNFKHGFVRRDLKKISNFASLLSFIKGIKNKTYDVSVSLHDVAASIGIVLESKRITGSENGPALSLVNDALHSYKQIRENMKVPLEAGLREMVWQAAVYAGKEKGFDAYIDNIRKKIGDFNTQSRGIADSVLRSHISADLVVLEHFSKSFRNDIEGILKKEDDYCVSVDAFRSLYDSRKSQGSIYTHRLSFLRG